MLLIHNIFVAAFILFVFFSLLNVQYTYSGFVTKGYFHLCPRMDFLQSLHINNSLYTNHENVSI